MSAFYDEGSFKVIVTERTTINRSLTDSELRGLNALGTPTWVYSQRMGSVSWANTVAKDIYFRTSQEFERQPQPTNEKPSALLGFYAKVEDDGCTVHVVGPKNILLSDQMHGDQTDSDEIVTLVVSPIAINDKNAILFQQVTLSADSFGKRLDVKSDDTPMDVIMKMLDLISVGIPVPAIHARALKEVIYSGNDMNQPIILTKAYKKMFPDEHGRQETVRHFLEQPMVLASSQNRLLDVATATATIFLSSKPKHDDASFLDGIESSWEFDAFTLANESQNMLPLLCMKLLKDNDIISRLQLNEAKLWNFLMKINDGYMGKQQYHNFMHASSVLHCIHMIMTKGGVAERLSTDPKSHALILLVAYIAAVIHDYQHLGVSNRFLIDTSAVLAIVYNDKSPQENNHAAAAFHLMQKDQYNFMESFSKENMRLFRNLIISMVLQTDMQHHFGLLTRFKLRAGARPDWSQDDSDIAIAMQLVLKCADMSHLAYSFPLHKRWVECLQEELFCQGDMERKAGLVVSPMSDRTNSGIIATQIDFFDFVAIKMFNLLSGEFDTHELTNGVMANYEQWKKGSHSMNDE